MITKCVNIFKQYLIQQSVLTCEEHQPRFCGHGNIRRGQNTSLEVELVGYAERGRNGRYDRFRHVNQTKYLGKLHKNPYHLLVVKLIY